MNTAEDLAGLISQDARLLTCLRAVAALGLPDCWIGAGAIRNRVWDALHGLAPGLYEDTDVDVVFFDAADRSAEREVLLEKQLAGMVPGADWQVRNQARMHLRNGDPAYRDKEDGLRYWPETATAIAARLDDGQVELLAPFGYGDLLDMAVRPTPAFRRKPGMFIARQAAKNWPARWPKLTFVD